METNPEAQLFVADQRGISQTDAYRRLFSFNFEDYAAEGREPFGTLYLFNEETLNPLARLPMTARQATTLLVVPLRGGLAFQTNGAEQLLSPGQAGTFALTAGQAYAIENLYNREAITWLHIGLAAANSPGTDSVAAIDLSQRNRLIPLTDLAAGYVGLYDGRADDTYAIPPGGAVFGYVVQGAFEVANRLMHAGDGLALRYAQAATLEFEALSSQAMLLLVRC